MSEAPRDQNYVPSMLFESSTTPGLTVPVQGDQSSGRLFVDLAGGAGTVTSVTGATANGFAVTTGANPTTTPVVTVSTTVTGILLGNGTSVSAATPGTDYVTASSTNTFTNKTYDTAGAGNSFSINGLAATANTGTGLVVRATSPTLTTAVLGSSTATTQTPADNSTKVATTAYVDAAVLGQNFKQAVTVATTTALATYVYNNGSSGVGATITLVGTGVISFDGTALTLGMRVLVKNETSTNAPNNGIYTVTTAGAIGVALILTRATDFNQSGEIDSGDSVFVTSGTTLTSTTWAYNGITAPTMGTTNITFAQTAGQGSFTAGNGIAITGVSIAIDTTVTVDKTTSQALTNKSYNGLTLTSTTGTFTLASGKTFIVINGLTLAGTDSTTMTFPSTSATIARTDAAQTFIGIQTIPQIVNTPLAATVTSNAATITRVSRINNFTNSSAATMAITLSTSGALDGDIIEVRIYDFSAVAQTIGWTNTEDSTVAAPLTSNGSTTLPLSALFQFNGSTSKWRTLAKS